MKTYIDNYSALLVLRNPESSNSDTYKAIKVVNEYNSCKQATDEQQKTKDFIQAYRQAKGLK